LDVITTSAIGKLGQVRVSVEDAAELQTMATKLSEDVAEAAPSEVRGRENYLPRRDMLQERLAWELARLRDVMRDVAVAYGEPLPVDCNLFDLQRILSRITLLDSRESQLIDRAVNMVRRNELGYPLASLLDVTRELNVLFRAKSRLMASAGPSVGDEGRTGAEVSG
jgi:hypothetical protein